MKIRENGFVWKIAFNWHSKQPRRKVSVCKVFWHFILGLFILWPLILLFLIIMLCIVNTFGFFMTHRANFPKTKGTDVTIPYKHWPTVLGHRVYPIAIIIPAGIIYFIYATWGRWIQLFKDVLRPIVDKGGTIFLVISGIVLLVLVIIGLRKFWHSEVGLLFREYSSAFHRKVCPYVDIIPAEKKKG